MRESVGSPTSVRLSTDEVPAIEREGIAREVFGRQIMRLDGGPIPGRPFHMDIKLRMFAQLKLVSGPVRGLDTRRTKELLSDGNDDVFLAIGQRGQMIIRQRECEVDVGSGKAFVGSCGELGHFVHVGCEAIRIMVPRRVLLPFVPHLDDRLATTLQSQNESLRLLIAYIGELDEERLAKAPELSHLAVSHVHDLMALAIGAGRDAGVFAAGRGLRAARTHAVKATIAALIGPRAISGEEVAAQHGISPRYMRKLFECEGTSFSAYVVEQRLLRAWRMLTAPRYAPLTISTIAYDVGFGDLSYFNRVFRRRFGASPSEIRAREQE